MTVELHPSIYVHPGDFLLTEVIEANGLNMADAAKRLGVTEQALDALLSERVDLSHDMALRFESAFGVKADTMMRMQAAYTAAGNATRG
jgi:addiction module HigA family antidote